MKLFRIVNNEVYVLWPGLACIVAILTAFGVFVHMVDRLVWG